MAAQREIEKSILLKSHDEQRTKELLAERYSLGGDQKPFINLMPTKIPPQKPKEKPKDELSKQRRLARDSLRKYIRSAQTAQRRAKRANIEVSKSKDIPQFDSFVELNRLWNSYIAELLSSHTGMPSMGKLASCDYHGAMLNVVAARNPSLVGLSGICVWEARSSFVLCTRDKGLKIVEKTGARFRVVADALSNEHKNYEIVGSRFVYRSAERSGRKFKPRAVDDL